MITGIMGLAITIMAIVLRKTEKKVKDLDERLKKLEPKDEKPDYEP